MRLETGRRHGAEAGPVVEAVEGRAPSTPIAPRPRHGLVWFSVRERVLPSGDVIVTGGKVVAKVSRVTPRCGRRLT